MPVPLTRFTPHLSRKLPLRAVLTIPFVAQIFIAVGLTGWLSLRNGQQAVNRVTAQLRQEIATRVQQYLSTYLEVPHQVNRITAESIRLGLLKAEDPVTFGRYCWQQIQIFNSARFIFIGYNAGGYAGATHEKDGTFSIDVTPGLGKGDISTYTTTRQGEFNKRINVIPDYNATTRSWYQAAVAAGGPMWSEVYQSVADPILGVTANQVVYNRQGKILGVLGVELDISGINPFLQTLKIGQSGQVFILERSGLLIASSTKESPFFQKPGVKELQRLKASESGIPLIRATGQYLNQTFGDLKQIKAGQQLDFEFKGERQFLQVQPFIDGRGLDWLVVVVVPESDFMEQIYANTRTTILLCLIALGVAATVGILTARWVILPILRLNAAAKAIAVGEWEMTPEVDRSDELGELANSFHSMAFQLRDSFATLEAKNTELQRLNQLKDEFLANTSHELRTPLNGMIGIAESLIDGVTGELPPATVANLAMIVSSGRRLSNLVNDILDFEKLRHQSLELQLKPISLRELTEVVVTLSQPLIGAKSLQLMNQISPDLPAVLADENRLQQILYNLVGNAIKFTESGTIKIFANSETEEIQDFPNISRETESGEHLQSQLASGKKIAITIADTGVGIAEDKLERIFESFEQGDGSTARQYGGTGLGLAITKQLVELQGGTIHVSSQIGVGSQFTFTLPISAELPISSKNVVALRQLPIVNREEINPAPMTNPYQLKDAPINILIVDDEPINLQVLINHLSLQNYAITQAISGEKALEIIEQGFKPDLILLDVMMPKMTGYEVTQKIREKFPATELPIVLLTAKNQIQDLVEGLNVGANDYLTKPISKDELIARIKTHVNLCRLRSENLRLNAQLEVTRQMQKMLLPADSELESIDG